MLRLFTTIATFVFFTLLAAFAAFAQDGGRDPEISIGSCYGNFNCTGPSSDVQGRAKGPQHVGCNGFINKFAVYAVCTSGEPLPPTPRWIWTVPLT